MDMYSKYKSPLGYSMGEDNIDTYGVDHSRFSIRDELSYQLARRQREKEIIKKYNELGITDNYPQSGTDFWGKAEEHNYGFGNSNTETQPKTTQDFYTSESAWGYPNNSQSSFYSKMGRPYNLQPDKYKLGNPADKIDYSLYGSGFSKEFIDEMVNNKEYQRALREYAIPNEGGYINNPNDPGGETNMGIAKRYHPNEDIKNLTRERANALLYKEIWNWNGINNLPPGIKGFVFDHGIRTSPQNAIETTHRALKIDPVGTIIGNTTLNRLQNTDYEEFLRRYQNLVKEQDKNRKNYRYFGEGWDNRTNRYHVSYSL